MTKNQQQKTKSLLIILISVIFVILIAFFFVQHSLLWKKQTQQKEIKTSIQKVSMMDIKSEFSFILDENGQPLTRAELDQEATQEANQEASQTAKIHETIIDDLVEYVDGEVLVQFKEKVKLVDLQVLGVVPIISISDDLVLLSITDEDTVKDKIETLKATGWFTSVAPNYVYQTDS
jgi:flagellar basal body-associated protein FliL